ncbi:phage coat protein [Hominibacterium faecale]|uniref:phage coat protein n=1 Tax=Hominibacterium faecale TaxID=2839743 RepID=UPI0022B29223|nr:phage coat protein [Hominibacterium faecale]
MASIFDKKNFNPEVFAKYVEKTPNLNRNELIKSKAIRRRDDIAQQFKDQVGGNYATIPIFARITGSRQNYDGGTDITANTSTTYTQGRIVVGRADAWTEKDFSYDITGGVDFLEQVAQQVGEYWDEVDQLTLLSVLKGIFSMTGAENKKFVDGHTYDVSANAGDAGMFGATTLNTAIQQALGDNKAKFSLAIMHSVVATNLENMNVVEYLKYTDKDGVERPTGLATINGKLILIDDAMPVEDVAAAEGAEAYTKYTSYVLGDGAIEFTDCGAKVPYETDRDPAKNGGQDTLYSRQRKIFAPYGISFTDSSIISPTDAQLETGSKWSLANSNESSKDYFPHKAIPIARIITRG